jgi:hypothetical protein
MKTNYQKQAEDFLTATNTTLEVLKAAPQKSPLWAGSENIPVRDHGINYSVTLKNNRHSYTFDFWGSIADADKIRHGEGHGTKPKAYDILACLSPLHEDNFKDFCRSFGYDTDSITGEKTYKACIEQDKNIKKLFTSEELELLTEIQ